MVWHVLRASASSVCRRRLLPPARGRCLLLHVPQRRWSQGAGAGSKCSAVRSSTVLGTLEAPSNEQQLPHIVTRAEAEDESEAQFYDSAERVPTLDGQMQRRVATLMAAQFLLSCGYGCIAPVLPALAVHLGVGSTSAGALLSFPAISRLLLNMPAGRMADDPRIGRRPLMVGGCGIMTVACAGSYGTESIELLLATRLLFGAGSAFAVAGTAAYIADISHISLAR